MDLIDVGGLTLSAAGVLLSIWALVIAGGAKKAVTEFLRKSSDQVSRDNVRELLATLHKARDAAMGQRKGASRMSSAGRRVANDLRELELAQDALATATVGSEERHLILRAAANELSAALAEINDNGDGWKAALVTLQNVIPGLAELEQRLAASTLR